MFETFALWRIYLIGSMYKEEGRMKCIMVVDDYFYEISIGTGTHNHNNAQDSKLYGEKLSIN